MTTPTERSSRAVGTDGCRNERNDPNDVTQGTHNANDEVLVYLFLFRFSSFIITTVSKLIFSPQPKFYTKKKEERKMKRRKKQVQYITTLMKQNGVILARLIKRAEHLDMKRKECDEMLNQVRMTMQENNV
jgi:hypothetical protein